MAVTPVPAAPVVPAFPGLAEKTAGTYNKSAYDWANAFPIAATAMKALADNAFANAGDANASATAAAASATSASDAKAAAFNAANFKGNWSALTGALAIPASVRHNGRIWLLVANVADVTTAQPGVSASWVSMDGALPLVHVTGTAQAIAAGNHYSLENAAISTATLPSTLLDGDIIWLTVKNGRTDNVLACNGLQIGGVVDDIQLVYATTYQFRFINNSLELL